MVAAIGGRVMVLRFACLLLFLLPSAALADQVWTRPVPEGVHRCDQYPHSAVWSGVEGAAVVEFTITAEGKVKDPQILRTTGDDDLDQAGLSCASRWTYKPATHDGVPTEMRWQAMVSFRMGPRTEPERPCRRYANITSTQIKSIGGVTKVSFRIMADGTVTAAEVLRSSGSDTLDQAALRCIGDQRFDTRRAVISDAGVPKTVSVDWRADLDPAN